jgi:chemotaxis protein CheZ
MQQYAPWVAAMSQALAVGDVESFGAALVGFDRARNCDVTMRVRLVASGLQGALKRFHVDSRLIDLAHHQVPDARHQLAYVLRLTDDAAHRTMDLVEQCCPLADQIAQQAERLVVAQGSAAPQEQIKAQIGQFLKQAGTSMAAVRSNLSEVLLTQGYQDLSGQIIRGVMALVDQLEQALGDLVRIAGTDSGTEIDTDAGNDADTGIDTRRGSGHGSSARGHGPSVPGVNHGPAVRGQQDVDDLLSDLGM